MYLYLLRRLATTFVSLFLIVTVTFFLMKAVPGDPFTQEKAIPEEILQAMRAHYKLDRPWYVQYGHYLLSVLSWDLGPSFKYPGRTVNQIIDQGFPTSALLGMEALLVSLGAGIGLGLAAAFYRSRWPDGLAMVLATLALSIPSFILAACLQYLFAMQWHLLPVARWGTFAQTILPTLSLAALPTAFIARLMRANLLEVLQQDYIKMARAKGLSPLTILVKHSLRNALLPVMSYFGPLAANVLTGSFVVEQIFGIPGLGQWFVTSISNRDYTVIMGTTVFYSLLLLFSVLVIDLLHAVFDPRIQLSQT